LAAKNKKLDNIMPLRTLKYDDLLGERHRCEEGVKATAANPGNTEVTNAECDKF
jgi:hypothetical protein